MSISIKELLKLENASDYKLHLACTNHEGTVPLNLFAQNYEEWLNWNRFRGKRNDWTREKIFSFIDYYPRGDSWLFGGAFDVIERRENGYEIRTEEKFQPYVGRLLANFKRPRGMRGRAFNFERYIDQFNLDSILSERFSGEQFPGFSDVNHEFWRLEPIFLTERSDWKSALSSFNGIYVITDTSNGKKYVGSAYGEGGIWSRWSQYIYTAHGHNDQLRKVISNNGIDYARKNFRFCILEWLNKLATPNEVILRENHWKKALDSVQHGYNHN
jgi:hypothetical protein